MLKKSLALILSLLLVAVMILPAMAAGLVPSIFKMETPRIDKWDSDYPGVKYDAIITKEDNTFVLGVTEPHLIVTPISALEKAPDDIREILEASYEKFVSSETLTDFCPSLETVLKGYDPSLVANDLIASDIFHVGLTDEYSKIVARDEYNLRVRFKLYADSEWLAAVLYSPNGKDWIALSEADILRGDDNLVTITLPNIGSLIFLFDGGTLAPADPDGPHSPQTGDLFPVPYLMAATALIFGGACITLRKVREK